jgi:hypothetical protein
METVAKRRGRPPGPRAKVVIEKAAAAENATETVISRPPVRRPMRDEDSREAAANRAAQILGHIQDNDIEGVDEFAAPPPPDGWSYEWKRHTTFNKEDPAYQIQLAQTGWEPVARERHPEMMPLNSSSPIIERKGMILMRRPAEVTEHFKKLEKRKAIDQVRAKEAQLSGKPEGGLGHRDHDKVKPRIKKDYSPLEVPAD